MVHGRYSVKTSMLIEYDLPGLSDPLVHQEPNPRPGMGQQSEAVKGAHGVWGRGRDKQRAG